MARNSFPTATYRLQFNNGFTFDDAAALVPYLSDLGVSHCYASPYLRARSGSPHGYDIVDHNALNPEIGNEASFRRLVGALERHDMGQILDLVPNHMGVFGDDNEWWLDVLENGPASTRAGFFDIDWRPLKEVLRGRVLVPVLGGHYGSILEAGDLKLRFDPGRGELSVYYWEHRFPLDPASYPMVLERDTAALEQSLGAEDPLWAEFQTLCSALRHLPARWDTTPERKTERQRDKEVHKRRLANLCGQSPAIHTHIEQQVAALNGDPQDPRSFDALHALLEQQAYRLAYWQVASDDINYRRFFDINDLAGLRMEDPEVFDATHRLVTELVASGQVDGLRLDHPDGLYDPEGYYRRLRGQMQSARAEAGNPGGPCYLVAEKILAVYEHLPADWPLEGTTGYEFASMLSGLFVYGDAEAEMDKAYTRFLGRSVDYDDLLYERKRLTIGVQLSSELSVLANILDHIAQLDRHTRDFTLNGLRDALRTIVASFPVYRTYMRDGQIREEDRRYVDWAVARAKKRSPAADISIFDFIRDILLREATAESNPEISALANRFTMKFQQYTAPVMAKALEDSTFYIYNRLVSLNEVGGDPRRFGTTLAAFHHTNQERLQNWPHSMLATSTHDTKRSGDVRARLNVITEMADEWQRLTTRWARLNRGKKTSVDDAPAPSRNDEYLLYQTLIGAWPLEALHGSGGLDAFRGRIQQYMGKAIKEAKVRTSWLNPNAPYEQATEAFVDALFAAPEQNRFLNESLPFARKVARFGLWNALVQTVLKLTAPGMPDVYQGDELWDFSLVDPDNRRPVDYTQRRELLDVLVDRADGDTPALVEEMLESLDDGRLKLYVVWRLLTLRRRLEHLFQAGDYQPLTVSGGADQHVCAFARSNGDLTVVVVAGRWFARLCDMDESVRPTGSIWQETAVDCPALHRLTDVLTRREIVPGETDDGCSLPVAELFASLPVAVLVGEASER